MNYQGPRHSFLAANLKSAIDNPMAVNIKISQELNLDRIAGPFDQPPFEHFWVSHLGLVAKKVPGECRMIHHLSFPKGHSVNDGISVEYSHVQYARIDDAIKLIKEVGQGCYLAKTDIKSAFCVIPIRPKDYRLLGMTWQGKFYFDKCLPMGCSSLCCTYECFSTALEWVAQNKLGIKYILHILDDFLIIARTAGLCEAQLTYFFIFARIWVCPWLPKKLLGQKQFCLLLGLSLTHANLRHVYPKIKYRSAWVCLTHF